MAAYGGDYDLLIDPIETKWDCLNVGGIWQNSPNNFDSSIQSFITLFIMTTTEGWIEFMLEGADSRGIDY